MRNIRRYVCIIDSFSYDCCDLTRANVNGTGYGLEYYLSDDESVSRQFFIHDQNYASLDYECPQYIFRCDTDGSCFTCDFIVRNITIRGVRDQEYRCTYETKAAGDGFVYRKIEERGTTLDDLRKILRL